VSHCCPRGLPTPPGARSAPSAWLLTGGQRTVAGGATLGTRDRRAPQWGARPVPAAPRPAGWEGGALLDLAPCRPPAIYLPTVGMPRATTRARRSHGRGAMWPHHPWPPARRACHPCYQTSWQLLAAPAPPAVPAARPAVWRPRRRGGQRQCALPARGRVPENRQPRSAGEWQAGVNRGNLELPGRGARAGCAGSPPRGSCAPARLNSAPCRTSALLACLCPHSRRTPRCSRRPGRCRLTPARPQAKMPPGTSLGYDRTRFFNKALDKASINVRYDQHHDDRPAAPRPPAMCCYRGSISPARPPPHPLPAPAGRRPFSEGRVGPDAGSAGGQLIGRGAQGWQGQAVIAGRRAPGGGRRHQPRRWPQPKLVKRGGASSAAAQQPRAPLPPRAWLTAAWRPAAVLPALPLVCVFVCVSGAARARRAVRRSCAPRPRDGVVAAPRACFPLAPPPLHVHPPGA